MRSSTLCLLFFHRLNAHLVSETNAIPDNAPTNIIVDPCDLDVHSSACKSRYKDPEAYTYRAFYESVLALRRLLEVEGRWGPDLNEDFDRLMEVDHRTLGNSRPISQPMNGVNNNAQGFVSEEREWTGHLTAGGSGTDVLSGNPSEDESTSSGEEGRSIENDRRPASNEMGEVQDAQSNSSGVTAETSETVSIATTPGSAEVPGPVSEDGSEVEDVSGVEVTGDSVQPFQTTESDTGSSIIDPVESPPPVSPETTPAYGLSREMRQDLLDMLEAGPSYADPIPPADAESIVREFEQAIQAGDARAVSRSISPILQAMGWPSTFPESLRNLHPLLNDSFPSDWYEKQSSVSELSPVTGDELVIDLANASGITSSSEDTYETLRLSDAESRELDESLSEDGGVEDGEFFQELSEARDHTEGGLDEQPESHDPTIPSDNQVTGTEPDGHIDEPTGEQDLITAPDIVDGSEAELSSLDSYGTPESPSTSQSESYFTVSEVEPDSAHSKIQQRSTKRERQERLEQKRKRKRYEISDHENDGDIESGTNDDGEPAPRRRKKGPREYRRGSRPDSEALEDDFQQRLSGTSQAGQLETVQEISTHPQPNPVTTTRFSIPSQRQADRTRQSAGRGDMLQRLGGGPPVDLVATGVTTTASTTALVSTTGLGLASVAGIAAMNASPGGYSRQRSDVSAYDDQERRIQVPTVEQREGDQDLDQESSLGQVYSGRDRQSQVATRDSSVLLKPDSYHGTSVPARTVDQEVDSDVIGLSRDDGPLTPDSVREILTGTDETDARGEAHVLTDKDPFVQQLKHGAPSRESSSFPIAVTHELAPDTPPPTPNRKKGKRFRMRLTLSRNGGDPVLVDKLCRNCD